MRPISCIFYYAKRVLRQGKPVLLSDGKSFRMNDNYISFLQVISAYWETLDEESGKKQLIVFLNGGSVLKDHNTGDIQTKAGYTITLPQFLGEPFIQQWYDWSCVFGIYTGASIPTARAIVNRAERPERTEARGHRNAAREEEFVDPAEFQEEVPQIEL